MDTLKKMFDAHPAPASDAGEKAFAAVTAAAECSLVCTACADACLSEEGDLAECARLNLDCAEICASVAHLLSRPGHQDRETLDTMLEACARSCSACAEECERHADFMEHCRICAESCRRCASACEEMSTALVA